jgi:hypothetical protein
MDIVIIVPHGKCYKGPRMCDTRAKETANRLFVKVKAAGHRVRMFMTPHIRKIHDYNRDSSWVTEFRERIRSYIESRTGPVLIYEVHSFPPDTKEMDENQMVIFDIKAGEMAGCTLLKALEPLNLDIVQVTGSPVCSLQTEFANRPGVFHHLLEFNESYDMLTKKEEERITSALTAFCLAPQLNLNCMRLRFGLLTYGMLIILVLILTWYLLYYPQYAADNSILFARHDRR